MKNILGKICLFVASVGLLSATSAFGGITVKLGTDTSRYSHYFSNLRATGGEFNAVTTGLGNVLDNYSSKAKTGNGFQTFCIDINDDFTPGTTYQAKLGLTITASSANEISIGTAFLYSQFAAGTLSGYNYTYGSKRVASAGWLQETLWALEGEYSSSVLYDNNNPFKNVLLNEFGSFTNAEKDSDGAYGVQVLQLYTVDKYGRVTIAQSQLVQCSVPHTSVPESSTVVAAALMLLPLGVSALKIVRRKQAVQK